jgi:hypothetical protein
MTTRPELLLALNTLPETEWSSEEELLEFLAERAPDLADPVLLRRALDYALTSGVLVRTGILIVRRRMVTEATARGFEGATGEFSTPGDPGNERLVLLGQSIARLDKRTGDLESKVTELQAARETGGSCWLQLIPSRMPRPVHEALRLQAIRILGMNVTDQAITSQMQLIAAQLLQQALQQT